MPKVVPILLPNHIFIVMHDNERQLFLPLSRSKSYQICTLEQLLLRPYGEGGILLTKSCTLEAVVMVRARIRNECDTKMWRMIDFKSHSGNVDFTCGTRRGTGDFALSIKNRRRLFSIIVPETQRLWSF